jgi:branched-chain amino acid transport system substrate-binding protein
MSRRAAILAALLAAALPVGLGDAASPDSLHIYSSLPLQGANRPQTLDVVRAERMALEEAGGVAGGHPVELISLDDSTRAAGKWAPEKVTANARRAGGDVRAIAYLGEFNSGGSAISIPFLNEAGVLQVSPSNTYVGLTRREAADPGEPDRYYPAGSRTYGRVAPADHLQAAATAKLLASLGVKRVLLLDDAEVYGYGMARMVRRRTAARGIWSRDPIHVEGGRWGARFKRMIRSIHPDAMVYGGITDNHAAAVFAAAHRVAPKMTLIGGDGVAESRFTRHLGTGVARRVLITSPTIPEAAYPPAGQAFYAAFRARYGHTPQTYGIYGYEAMTVVLGAIDSGAGDPTATIKAFFATRDRDSVLGRYSIDSDGDTTLATYGVYRVEKRQLVFDRVIDSST